MRVSTSISVRLIVERSDELGQMFSRNFLENTVFVQTSNSRHEAALRRTLLRTCGVVACELLLVVKPTVPFC